MKLDQTVFKSLQNRYQSDAITCSCVEFRKPIGGASDEKIEFFNPRPLIVSKIMTGFSSDTIEVTCKTSTGSVVYINLHTIPSLNLVPRFVKNTDSKLSVLLLGLESISLSEFRRRMPLTFDYITKNMSMFIFNSKFKTF